MSSTPIEQFSIKCRQNADGSWRQAYVIPADVDHRRIISVSGPGTVYYGSSSSITDQVNTGTLTAGQTLTTTSALWVHTSSENLLSITESALFGQANLAMADNKRLTFTANTPGGGISRLIEFHMTTTFDRPWLSWFDENNRHRAAVGYHTTDASEGGIHQAFELKTVADAVGLFPTDMRTRFSIGTNSDRVLTGFNYSTGIEINQGEVPTDTSGSAIVEQFGLTLRGYKRDGSASQIVGQFVVETETTDAVTGFLDVINVSASQPHQLVVFKSASSSSGSCGLFVKRGNGSNTDAFVFKNRTGVFEIGPVATVPTGAATNGRLYVAANGALTYVSPAGTVTAIGPA